IPSTRTKEVVSLLNQAFPQIHGGTSVMETSLGNPNAMMHPAPSLLNASLIESKRKWLYYWDGITPSIGAFVEEMDKERLSLAKLFGLNLPSIKEWYKAAYDVEADTLHELIKKNKAYARVEGQKTLHTRYLLEDIPMGLVPMVSLGKMLGAKVERMETIVKLGEYILDKDLTSGGRTMENIGLSDMVANNIKECLETGNIN
ncbi:MAG: NADP transhydrogenase subunit alpha, partial [Desulfobacteraceae bacterium]|nr:NADP transhydrogenase subunit alpha [Desulfobacteraceae bacterium]